nr:ribonuclease H-like domain-containing protein [Tanacetum cinerariifolium]
MGTGSKKGGLYFFDEGKKVTNSNIKSCYVSNCIWHNRLGHPSDQVLTMLKNKINGLNQDNSGPCDICHKAKQMRKPFPLSEHKSKNSDDLVHLDVWGPYKNSNDNTVEAAASNKDIQTDGTNSINITGSTSSRKVINENEYATEIGSITKIHELATYLEAVKDSRMAPSDDLEYYYDNIDLEGFGEEVEEEANSSCFHTRQRHLGKVSKMIIDDNDDEHVANNIVAKGVDYDIVVMEVINDNIIVSNDNVGAIWCTHSFSPTNEEYVDVMGIIGGGETIILDVDIEVHNFFVDDIVVHPTVDAMESLDDTTDNVDNGDFTYVSNFMIVEDINLIIDPSLLQVVLGKPFIEISNMTPDLSLGIVKFANETDEIAYKMPYKIDQFDSLSDLEKEHTKSVYFRNEEDKIR